MSPAMIIRRVDTLSVAAEFDDDLVSRCAPVLQAKGIEWPQAGIRKVRRWSMKPGQKMDLPKGVPFRA
jgi:hypothetical protein